MEEPQRLSARLLEDASALRSHILRTLHESWVTDSIFPHETWDGVASSSVMLLLGECVIAKARGPEICIILNKRSQRVRQAGDLCCPGGGVETQLDPRLAKLIALPGFPMAAWPYWRSLRREQPNEARLLSLMLATALREGWEEMRLNPFGTRFLGALPYQRLVMFRIVIHPMVGWVTRQRRFVPSWEVEKIVRIPLRWLLDPEGYAVYRFHVPPHLEHRINRGTQDFPCFLWRCRDEVERLWGATYKIVALFMELVFGFKPPDPSTLPLVEGEMNEEYINGRSE